MNNLENKNSQSNVAYLFPFLMLFIALTLMSFKVETPVSIINETCPTANFIVDNNGCVAPCEMIFTNASLHAKSFLWNFGDGTTSTELNPRHAFALPNSYTVSLTAFSDGCQSEYIIIVDTIDN